MEQQETFLSLKIEADVLNLCSPIFSFVASHLGHRLIFYVSAFFFLEFALLSAAFKLTHFYTITFIFFVFLCKANSIFSSPIWRITQSKHMNSTLS